MEILNTYTDLSGAIALLILFVLISIVSFIGIFIEWESGTIKSRVTWIVATIISVSITTFGGIYAFTHPEVKHDVIIHDMSQFNYSKYEIVQQNGKLITVKEK